MLMGNLLFYILGEYIEWSEPMSFGNPPFFSSRSERRGNRPGIGGVSPGKALIDDVFASLTVISIRKTWPQNPFQAAPVVRCAH